MKKLKEKKLEVLPEQTSEKKSGQSSGRGLGSSLFSQRETVQRMTKEEVED